jgi:hypothetical protein
MEIFVLKEGSFFLRSVSKNTHTVTLLAEQAWWTVSHTEAQEMADRPALKCQSHRLGVTPWELCPETQKPRSLEAWKIAQAARSIVL